jgi:hypothetical protein
MLSAALLAVALPEQGSRPAPRRIEHGPPVKDLDKFIYWAQTFGIPAHYLWFKMPASKSNASGTPEASPTWSAASEADDVDRNQFLRLAGSSLVHRLSPHCCMDGPARLLHSRQS